MFASDEIIEAEQKLCKHIKCMAHVLNHPECFHGVSVQEQIDILRERLNEYDLLVGNMREI
jgi:hypothetical protein